MTIKSFFYEDDGVVKRVEAESFTRVTTPGEVARCSNVTYNVVVTARLECDPSTFGAPNVFATRTFSYGSAPGPVWPFKVPGDSYSGRGSGNRLQLPPITTLNPDGSRRYSFPRQFSTKPGLARSWRWWIVEILNVEATRNDGLPDDCGLPGNCSTQFLIGNQTVYELNSCPEISEGEPPDTCRNCCRELLPLLRNIRV